MDFELTPLHCERKIVLANAVQWGGTEIRSGGGGGGLRERLRSSQLSARSVRVRRSKIGGAKAPLSPRFGHPCYSCVTILAMLRWHGSLSAKVTKNANLGYSHDRGLS